MAKFLSWFLGLPIAVLIIALAVANRHAVGFSLDPTSTSNPLVSFEIPLYLLLLATIILGIFIGGASSWLNQSKWRRAAKDARHEVSEVRSESLALKRKAAGSDGGLVPRNS